VETAADIFQEFGAAVLRSGEKAYQKRLQHNATATWVYWLCSNPNWPHCQTQPIDGYDSLLHADKVGQCKNRFNVVPEGISARQNRSSKDQPNSREVMTVYRALPCGITSLVTKWSHSWSVTNRRKKNRLAKNFIIVEHSGNARTLKIRRAGEAMMSSLLCWRQGFRLENCPSIWLLLNRQT